LNQNGFRVVEWEPQGEGTTKGEVLVSYAGSPDIFVEVKQPSWHGECLPQNIAERNRLSQADTAKRYQRMKQEKFLPGVIEGGAAGSHHFAMSVVRRNALPKFTDKRPNLAIVVDDTKITVVGMSFGSNLKASTSRYHRSAMPMINILQAIRSAWNSSSQLRPT
jgi:hypothetical protein